MYLFSFLGQEKREKKDICQLSTRTICLIFCLKHVRTHAYEKQPTTTNREEKKTQTYSLQMTKRLSSILISNKTLKIKTFKLLEKETTRYSLRNKSHFLYFTI